MSAASGPWKLGSWLRRHSLTLVAAVGGAVGVAFAAGWYPPPSAEATKPPAIAQVAAPVAVDAQDTVQIALILDTSSSMDGLINQARSQLWTMVDQMGRMTREVNGKTRGVKIELALYEYGNATIPSLQGHIRQILPLTADLDTVSEKLHALTTNGGEEYAGQAIQVAANWLQWSTDPNALKFVFLAGNESFDQGPVSAASAMAQATGKGIHVQLIHAGGKDRSWEAAAALAKSDLMMIDQNHVVQHIASPQDAEILQLGNELNNTYMAYGDDGDAAATRQAKADASSAKLSPKVALERAQLKSKNSYNNARWDVVDAVAKDKGFLASANDGQLPPALRGKSLAEKQQIVEGNAVKRAEIKAKIGKLEADRKAFVDAERAKRAAEPESLETGLMKSARKAAGKKGYKL